MNLMRLQSCSSRNVFLWLSCVVFAVMLSSCAAPKKNMSAGQTVPDLIPQTSTSSLRPFIPPYATSSTQLMNTVHEVAPMETLWRISKMYDVTQQDIMQANSLADANALKVGQKLVIPNASSLKSFIPLYPNNRWKFIIVHHTASDIGNARLVNAWHKNRGWEGIGYHFLIDNGSVGKGDGQIEVAPRWIKQQQGAHCKACDMNEMSIGISLVGNFSKTSPSQAQIDSLTFLTRELMKYYRIPEQNVIKHGAVSGANTECPGTRFPWQDFKRQIA